MIERYLTGGDPDPAYACPPFNSDAAHREALIDRFNDGEAED